jgi:hypothetical protein
MVTHSKTCQKKDKLETASKIFGGKKDLNKLKTFQYFRKQKKNGSHFWSIYPTLKLKNRQYLVN